MGVIEDLIEALQASWRRRKRTISFILLFLICLIFMLPGSYIVLCVVFDLDTELVTNLLSYIRNHIIELNLVQVILSILTTVGMAYSSAKACTTQEFTAAEVHARAKRTWWKPLVTLLLLELLWRMPVLLLGVEARVPGLIESVVNVLDGSLLLVVVVVLTGVGLVAWLAAFGTIEKLCIVVALVEGSDGVEALCKAWNTVSGKKLQVALLVVVMELWVLVCFTGTNFYKTSWRQVVVDFQLDLMGIMQWLVVVPLYRNRSS